MRKALLAPLALAAMLFTAAPAAAVPQPVVPPPKAPFTKVDTAGDGTIAAITKNLKGEPVLVVRHAGNVLTVYTNIDAVAVKKGDTVKRGQAIAKVRASDPAFLHFEVRQGFDSVDPMRYLQ